MPQEKLQISDVIECRACVVGKRENCKVCNGTGHTTVQILQERLLETKMGTVEPIFDTNPRRGTEEGSDHDKLGFIRGCLRKYKDTTASRRGIVDYIDGIVNK